MRSTARSPCFQLGFSAKVGLSSRSTKCRARGSHASGGGATARGGPARPPPPRARGRHGREGDGGASDEGYVAALREVREISVRHGYPPHRAAALFALRCARGWLRRRLERSLPPALRAVPRRLANPRCGAAA